MSYKNITLDNFVSNRILDDTKGWVDFNQSLSEFNIESLIDLITGRSKKRDQITRALNNIKNIKSYGIYSRLYFDNGAWSYCAGQDYPGELAYIRKLLARG